MSDSISNNQRIAKNTIFLYARMLLIMVITLYTSRVVLRVLGEEDYGIQNVVGGFITVLSFLSTTIASAVSRFFAFEIGRGDYKRLNQYFNLSLLAYLMVGFIVVVLGETVGLWFVANKLTIPADRMQAAMWVYQFSIVSFLVQMFAVPYNSLIIAKEKMDIYAYISIIEVVLKLSVVYLLTISAFDKLIFYSFLLFVVTTFVQGLYAAYCRMKYREESRIRIYWDRTMFNDILHYSGWVFFGAVSSICRGQGLNIVLNIFFGPIVNAARGIAYQVNSAINQLVNSFYTACRPQITKLYAQGNNEAMMNLVFQSSRLCYYLVFILSLPIVIKVDGILNLWLGSYPEYTALFTQLVIIIAVIDSIGYPFQGAISATGNIKWYQIVTGCLTILNLPIAYVLLKIGYGPEYAMITGIVLAIVSQISRMIFMKRNLNMSVRIYIKEVGLRLLAVTTISYFAAQLLNHLMIGSGLLQLLSYCALVVALTAITTYIVGITNSERKYVHKLLRQIMKK